jgi:glycosyltransferase involved in cell wall biosynthesis
MDRVAILIPCYNEAQTIGKVIDDWKKEVPNGIIYVYDNNSTDQTDKIAHNHGAIVRHEYRQGKGNVIRTMFREIDAECYIMVDGDDTYPAEYGKKMMDLVLNRKADMVIGDRLSSTYFEENKRPFHNFGNALVRNVINHLFRSNIQDIMTGYRAFSYLFVKTFPVLSKGFEIETEMTIHAIDKNMRIENVIINYRNRPKGSNSKLNTYSDGIKVLKTIGILYKNYKPFEFFGWFSLFSYIVSISFFVSVFIDYIKTGMVLRFPTLIVSGFIFLVATISLFCGFVLSAIAAKNKQDFEFRLQMTEEKKKNII